MDIKEVKEKVRKLLALANSPNENEAAIAAAKAQELCDQFNLEAAKIGKGDSTSSPDLERLEISPLKKREIWELMLFSCLCEVLECTGWFQNNGRGSRRFMVVGYPADVSLFQFLYPYLERVIVTHYKESLTEAKAAASWWNRRRTYSYKRGFCHGAIERIFERLKEMRDSRREGDPDTRALVVVKEREIEKWVEQNLGLEKNKTQYKISMDKSGYIAGQMAGEAINLNRPLEGGTPVNGRQYLSEI